MSTVTSKKPNPAQETAIRCVPLSSGEAAANLRLCAVLREQPDAATGHLILLRQTPEARVVLGAACDADGSVREWLELWIQDIDTTPAGETLIVSNVARDTAWQQLVTRLRGADPAGAFSSRSEKTPPRPVFINLATWQPWHPATEAGEVEVVCDDSTLATASLPKYSESTARFGRAASGGPFVQLNEEARAASAAIALRTLDPSGASLVALNPGGGMIFARRFAPLGVEEFADLLGGRP